MFYVNLVLVIVFLTFWGNCLRKPSVLYNVTSSAILNNFISRLTLVCFLQGVTKRCRLSWLTNRPSYMNTNAEGGGGVAGSQTWVQLYTGDQINFEDLTPYLTYGFLSCWGICIHQPRHRTSLHLHLCPLHPWGVSGGREFTHTVHWKKRLTIFPSLPRMSLTKLSLAGKNSITPVPTRESLVSDIPAGDGRTANLFLQCTLYQQRTC